MTTTPRFHPAQTAGRCRQNGMDRHTSNDQDCISVAVAFVATQHGAAERILRAHRLRLGGSCTGCIHTPTVWPCSIAGIALRVQQSSA